MAQYPKQFSLGNIWNHINLCSARGVDNFKVPYSLTPFTNKEVPEFFISRVFPTSLVIPVWSVHSTMGVFSRWWRRRSNCGITKYHNPPVRLVGQSQFPASLSPSYTFSRSSVPGVSLNGKHEKLELDLEQVFDLVGFQLAWKSVRSDPP